MLCFPWKWVLSSELYCSCSSSILDETWISKATWSQFAAIFPFNNAFAIWLTSLFESATYPALLLFCCWIMLWERISFVDFFFFWFNIREGDGRDPLLLLCVVRVWVLHYHSLWNGMGFVPKMRFYLSQTSNWLRTRWFKTSLYTWLMDFCSL